MPTGRKVQIVGVGACTAIGHDAPSTAAAVRAAISGFDDHPYFMDGAGDPVVMARAFTSYEGMGLAEDLLALAIPAANESLANLLRSKKRITGIPLVLGLPPIRPGRPADLDAELADRCKQELGGGILLSAVRTIPHGHASGLEALEQAWRLIRAGDIEACLIGGADSYDHPETIEWLDSSEQLHSKTNTWGFIPGQAAGFVLLASDKFAQEHSLPLLGEVKEAALTREAKLIKTDSVCLGEGLSTAVRRVAEALPSGNQLIDQTICDLNGERYRATELGYMLARNGERFTDAGEYIAPADCWGDVGAASAPLYIGLAVAAGQKGYAKGPNTLIWSSSEGGERGAAIVRVEVAGSS